MNLRKSLITSGSALTLLLASGCQTSNPTYTSTQNPYLLGRNEALPPVTLDPNTGAPVANETLPAPVVESETEGLNGLGQLEFIDSQESNQQANEVPPIADEYKAPKQEAPRYYTVKKGDTLSEIALTYGISYKTLASENNISVKKALRIGQKLKLPAGASAKADKSRLKKGKPTGKTTKASSKNGTYKVKNGENLWTIPKKLGVSRKDFMSANGFTKSTVLQIGQTVIVPGKPGNHSSGSSKSTRRSQGTISYNTNASASGKTYTVKNGDNPWTIAKKLKVRHSDLMSVNNLNSSAMLKIGQVLSIPGKAQASSRKEPTMAAAPAPTPEPTIGIVVDQPTESSNTDLIVAAPATPAEPETAATKEHITYPYDVMEGDTLENLTTIHNTTVEELKKHNPTIQSNEDLKPGISISIPFKD